ncbi:MAG: hypothetical protein AABY90_00480, partial [Nitrospirota bacterium]
MRTAEKGNGAPQRRRNAPPQQHSADEPSTTRHDPPAGGLYDGAVPAQTPALQSSAEPTRDPRVDNDHSSIRTPTDCHFDDATRRTFH